MNTVQLSDHRLANFVQSALLLTGMALLLGVLGWILAGFEGLVWTVVLGAIVLAFSPRLSTRVLLRMYGAWPLGTEQAPGLHGIVLELARRAGLSSLPRLYYLPSTMMNAFTIGRRDEAAIVVSDGLLRRLSGRELAGVLAHELSHVRNNDIWVMGLADLVSRLTGVMSLAGQIMLVVSLPLMLFGEADIALLPLVLLIAAPTISALLQLALSRTRELRADLDAVSLTGDPHGLASALRKLEANRSGWWERIFLPGRRVPEPSLLRTHPPTDERIRRLMSLVPAVGPADRRMPLDAWGRLMGPGYPRVTRLPRWHIGGLWY